jgi:hypothetical protein
MEYVYTLTHNSNSTFIAESIGFQCLLVKLVDDMAQYQFYKLPRYNMTWLFALDIDDDVKALPPNTILLSNKEIAAYQKADALKSFW